MSLRQFLILIVVIGFIIGIILFFYLNNFSKHMVVSESKKLKTRVPYIAGHFYPREKTELKKMLQGFFKIAKENLSSEPFYKSKPRIIIVPHAGYVYSGKVAAFGFEALAPFSFQRAIILGRSHQAFFEKVALDTSDVWKTPVGNLFVDKEFAGKLLQEGKYFIEENCLVHQREHSLEVQLPFLLEIQGKKIKIVPLLFGSDNITLAEKLAWLLNKLMDEKTILIISTDLSHYPSYEFANATDQATIEKILQLETDELHNENLKTESMQSQNLLTLLCAEPAVLTAMFLAKQNALQAQLLKYANSGDFFSDNRERVVGYAAIAFYESRKETNEFKNVSFQELNSEEQKIALKIARQTLAMAFENKKYEIPSSLPSIFQEKRGVFVTLKKEGKLRGCIGNFNPSISLAENIQTMVLAAAFEDRRFLPLSKEELPEIKIEISILSPLQRIFDYNLIEIGQHGVYIKKGPHSGVYLPQVATELGWTKEEFLRSLCYEKAGLSPDCWKDKETELYIFTAQVFGE